MPSNGSLRVALTHGGKRMELDAAELEQLLELPGLARRLPALFVQGGRGSTENLPSLPVTLNASQESSGTQGGSSRGVGGASCDEPVDDVDNFAGYLADAFDDAKSLAWYRKVVRTLPRPVVQDALVRTREARRSDIRRSRAALFTSIVRPLMPPKPSSRYANSPPSSP
jgi:hypothetical protein